MVQIWRKSTIGGHSTMGRHSTLELQLFLILLHRNVNTWRDGRDMVHINGYLNFNRGRKSILNVIIVTILSAPSASLKCRD